jgi:hypothetical protein
MMNVMLATQRVLLALLKLLLGPGRLMKLGFEYLTRLLSECLFHEPAGIPAFRTRKTFGLHGGLTVRSDCDFDGFQATPPI